MAEEKKPEPNKREPLFVVHPDDLKTEKQQEDLLDHVADQVVDAVNAERKRQGKPPLKED